MTWSFRVWHANVLKLLINAAFKFNAGRSKYNIRYEKDLTYAEDTTGSFGKAIFIKLSNIVCNKFLDQRKIFSYEFDVFNALNICLIVTCLIFCRSWEFVLQIWGKTSHWAKSVEYGCFGLIICHNWGSIYEFVSIILAVFNRFSNPTVWCHQITLVVDHLSTKENLKWNQTSDFEKR